MTLVRVCEVFFTFVCNFKGVGNGILSISAARSVFSEGTTVVSEALVLLASFPASFILLDASQFFERFENGAFEGYLGEATTSEFSVKEESRLGSGRTTVS